MLKRPEGLWPFTVMVLDQIELIGCPVFKIEAHDPAEPEEPDFLWGELTPHLELSEGEYLRIDQEAGFFNAEFGMRSCCGGDPTWGEQRWLKPSAENAALVASAYCHNFAQQTEP
ncbi:TPA: hypothetical protein SMW50_005808 [Pseudomonas aeruginosa]|nr:hypothetical protein [Pseudomonas aeruginosa]HEK3716911.1 hypothetical protein [Pseudomonas aeruginosa]